MFILHVMCLVYDFNNESNVAGPWSLIYCMSIIGPNARNKLLNAPKAGIMQNVTT